MMKKRVIKLSLFNPSANDKAVRELQDYAKWLETKGEELSQELTARGWDVATTWYGEVISQYYKGPIDGVGVDVEDRGNGKYAIVAHGEVYVILEFGAGVTYGFVPHPQADEFGFGPTTYPGQTHAADPKGWYLPKSAGGGHTYGNPPSMAMYEASKTLRDELVEIAREVFSK